MSKTLQNGSFQDAVGTVVNAGTIEFVLSQDAALIAGGQVAPTRVSATLDSSGDMPGAFTIAANDELTPSGTFYLTTVFDSNGARVFGPERWVFSGASPIDLDLMVPTIIDPAFASPVLLNPTAAQSILDFNLTTPLLNNVRVVDGVKFTTIQGAVDDLPAAGGTVFIPAGTYDISTAVARDMNDLHIVGAGAGVTVIRTTAVGIDAFTFGNGTTTRSRNSIRNVTISTTVTKTGGAGIYFNRIQDGWVTGVDFSSQFQNVRIADNSSIIKLNQIRSIDVVPTTGVGFLIEGGNDHYLSQIVMDNPVASQPLAGIRIQKTDATWISDVDIIRSGTGLLIDPQGSDLVDHLFVVNSAFDSGTEQGIMINPATGAKVRRSTFTGCWTASSSAEAGIRLDAGGTIQAIRFFNHRSYLNFLQGVLFQNGTDLEFSYGEVAGNSVTGSGTTHGIDVSAGVTDFRLIGSRVGPIAGFANTQGWGIIVAAGGSDNYIITNNDLRGNVTGALSDGGTGVEKTIFGNLPRSTVNHILPNPLEGTLSSIPRWIFKLVDHTDMTAASTAGTFTLWTLPANTMIHDVIGTVTAAWAGTGPVSAAVASVGTQAGPANDLALDDNFFATGTRYELHDGTAVGGKGSLLFDATDKFAPHMFLAGGVIELQMDLTGGNHADTSAGQARIYMLVSQPLGNTTIEAN